MLDLYWKKLFYFRENKGYTRVSFYINDDISLAQKGDVVGRDRG